MLEALQSVTTAWAQATLAWLGTPLSRQGDLLRHADGFVAQVDVSCTAALPAVLLALALGVAGALRATAPRRIALAIGLGALAVVLANQVRLVAALWVGVHAPAHFHWVHVAAGPLLLVAAGAAVVRAMLWHDGRDVGERRTA